MTNNIFGIVVLIGGRGSNLQALIDHPQRGKTYQIVGVISHKAGAYGLERAKKAQIPTRVIEPTNFSSPRQFEEALTEATKAFTPSLIVLAGFMRVLSEFFISHFENQIINIHPALLPKYKGLHTHRRVLEEKEKEHGASIHFVTAELDSGPIIACAKVVVSDTDDEAALSQRVLRVEHWLYPQVVCWFAENRLKVIQNTVVLEGRLIPPLGLELTPPIEQGILR